MKHCYKHLKPINQLSLIEKLILEPHKFSYVKAMDIAIKYSGNVHIKNNLRYSSKYSDIEKVEGIKDRYIEMYTNLPCAYGIDGTLPDIYVEDYILYNHQSKRAMIDFFDIFHSRIAQTQYKFLKYRDLSSATCPVEQSLVGKLMRNLSGYPTDRDFYRSIKAYLPLQIAISAHNLFWSTSRSTLGLKILLRDFFNLPIEIEEFQGRLLEIPVEEQSSMGIKMGKYNKLNVSAILDRKFYKPDDGINVIVGSLEYKQYLNFLPKISKRDKPFSNFAKLVELIRMYVPIDVTVNIKILLKPGKVGCTYLNKTYVLGRNTFIMGYNKGVVYNKTI